MNRLLKMCINWRVVVGLAIVGLGIWVFAPDVVVRALPVLLLAACPVSMLVMMATMRQPTTPAPAPEDINSLETQLAELTAQQEQVKAQLARLGSPQPNPNGVK